MVQQLKVSPFEDPAVLNEARSFESFPLLAASCVLKSFDFAACVSYLLFVFNRLYTCDCLHHDGLPSGL